MEIFNAVCKSLTAIFIVLCICATIVNVTDKTTEPAEKFNVCDVMFDTYVVVSIESEENATQYDVYDQNTYIMYRIIESNGNYSIIPIYDSDGNLQKHEIIIQEHIPDNIISPDVV